MRILVCVKQVIDPESVLELTDSGWFRQKLLAYRINRYDEYALEEAILIKESFSDVTIDAISVGPDRVRQVITKAMEKGVDRGIHIRIEEEGYLSPSLTASLIADYAESISYDLILTGVMAEDDMQCQVGPSIAAKLPTSCAVSVISQSLDLDHKSVTVECELEGGIREQVLLPLPALLAVQSGINRPRYPTLSNVLRAQSQEIIIIENRLHQQGLPQDRMIEITHPDKSARGEILKGDTEAKASKLISILRERSLL
jgi:electron transfer flavoprotein beta subunit